MYYYIINPAAGKGAIDNIQDKLKGTLHQLKIDGEFAKTLGRGDAARITTRALERGVKTIVAVGGDNTAREIIETLYHSGRDQVALGIIPIGKRNVLASHLGLTSWRQACDVLSVRRIAEFNLIRCNQDVCIYACNFGPLPVSADGPVEAASEYVEYTATIDGHYKISGKARGLAVLNQKFLRNGLSNGLVLQIYPYRPTKDGGWGRWLPWKRDTSGDGPTYSQLHANKISLEFSHATLGNLDGKKVIKQQFSLKLSERHLRLITARDIAETASVN